MRRFLLSTVVFTLLSFAVKAQTAEVSENLTQIYKSGWSRFYSYNYPSKDAAGNDVVLSSLLIAWTPVVPSDQDSIESLHIYSHYTIAADRERPTSDQNHQDHILFGLLVRGSYGTDSSCKFISRCVVIAPDYQGFGVTSSQNHPYLSQELTARQVVDAVQYGRQLYDKLVAEGSALPFKSDWRSHAYGFSQGGAVTLAVQRYLEENALDEDLRFQGSICGDGPYDLMATLRYYLEDDGNSFGATTSHRKGFCTLPMVLPMIVKGMLDTHPDMAGHSLGDYFSQQFLDTGIMDWLASKEFSDNEISGKWYRQLQEGLDADGRHYSPEQMAGLFYSPDKDNVWGRLDGIFTPGLFEYLSNPDNLGSVPTERGDAWQDLHRALADNNVASGWEPRHRIQFLHSRGDMVVPYSNYLSFCDAHPFGEGNQYRMDDSATPSDHTSAGTTFFLQLTTTAGFGKYFKWLNEPFDATGISTPGSLTPALSQGERVYNLMGQKVNSQFPVLNSQFKRGVYIKNGKKMIR